MAAMLGMTAMPGMTVMLGMTAMPGMSAMLRVTAARRLGYGAIRRRPVVPGGHKNAPVGMGAAADGVGRAALGFSGGLLQLR